jgi:hypothetical protein
LSTTNPEATKITLANAIVPPLRAGAYAVTAKQTLPDFGTFESAPVKFNVRGPRFSLLPDDVYSIYPPDGQTGSYEGTVPHVIFKRKTLPWERKIKPDGNDGTADADEIPPRPWMALLMLTDEEFSNGTVEIATTEIADLFRQKNEAVSNGLWRADITESADDADTTIRDVAGVKAPPRCATICMSWDLFTRIAPRADELSFLAHARGVSATDKEDVAGIGDGWFSVLLGNRFPLATKNSPVGGLHHVFLVSLEGCAALLTGQTIANLKRVRLPLLTKWSFRPQGDSFEKILRTLAGWPKDGWLRIRPTADVGAPDVETALARGYVPMPHMLRLGSPTVSWYRGPLLPYVPRDTGRRLDYATADAALRLDPDTGMFDVSYAAAWQLGRLLALQAAEFARALFHQRSTHVADALVRRARELAEAAGTEQGSAWNATAARDAAALLQNELMAAIALECVPDLRTPRT